MEKAPDNSKRTDECKLLDGSWYRCKNIKVVLDPKRPSTEKFVCLTCGAFYDIVAKEF